MVNSLSAIQFKRIALQQQFNCALEQISLKEFEENTNPFEIYIYNYMNHKSPGFDSFFNLDRVDFVLSEILKKTETGSFKAILHGSSFYLDQGTSDIDMRVYMTTKSKATKLGKHFKKLPFTREPHEGTSYFSIKACFTNYSSGKSCNLDITFTQNDEQCYRSNYDRFGIVVYPKLGIHDKKPQSFVGSLLPQVLIESSTQLTSKRQV